MTSEETEGAGKYQMAAHVGSENCSRASDSRQQQSMQERPGYSQAEFNRVATTVWPPRQVRMISVFPVTKMESQRLQPAQAREVALLSLTLPLLTVLITCYRHNQTSSCPLMIPEAL